MTDIVVPRNTSLDEYFMLHAHLVATRSTCDRGPELLLDPGRHGVGAVIIKDRRIIASGYSGSPPGEPHCNEFECEVCGTKFTQKETAATGRTCNVCQDGGSIVGGHIMVDNHCVRTIHAEMNAIIQCALDGVSPKKGYLYCTASPCYDCAKVIVRAGLSRVIVANHYSSRYGLSNSSRDLFERAGISYEQLKSE
jgi:dCMP deaminase